MEQVNQFNQQKRLKDQIYQLLGKNEKLENEFEKMCRFMSEINTMIIDGMEIP